MKPRNRNNNKIALAITLCICSSLAPQAAISMPEKIQDESNLTHTPSLSSLSSEDMIHLFGKKSGGAAHSQIAYITEEEMHRTEGKNPAVVAAAAYTGIAFLGGGAASITNDLVNDQSINWSNAFAAATGAAWIAGSQALLTASGVGGIAANATATVIGIAAGAATLNGINQLSNSSSGGGHGSNCNGCH